MKNFKNKKMEGFPNKTKSISHMFASFLKNSIRNKSQKNTNLFFREHERLFNLYFFDHKKTYQYTPIFLSFVSDNIIMNDMFTLKKVRDFFTYKP